MPRSARAFSFFANFEMEKIAQKKSFAVRQRGGGNRGNFFEGFVSMKKR
jgi:hypothetical protein